MNPLKGQELPRLTLLEDIVSQVDNSMRNRMVMMDYHMSYEVSGKVFGVDIFSKEAKIIQIRITLNE